MHERERQANNTNGTEQPTNHNLQIPSVNVLNICHVSSQNIGDHRLPQILAQFRQNQHGIIYYLYLFPVCYPFIESRLVRYTFSFLRLPLIYHVSNRILQGLLRQSTSQIYKCFFLNACIRILLHKIPVSQQHVTYKRCFCSRITLAMSAFQICIRSFKLCSYFVSLQYCECN